MPSLQRVEKLLGQVIPRIANSGTAISLLRPGQKGKPSAHHPPLFRPESHTYYELVVCCEGPMLIVASDQLHRLETGDAMMIVPGAWHYESYCRAEQAYDAVWFIRLPSGLIGVPATYRRGQFRFFHWNMEDPVVMRPTTIEELAHELTQQQTDWEMKARSLLIHLLVDVRRCIAESETPLRLGRLDPVQQACVILETRFREPLQIKSLAAEVGLSPNYLSHQFRLAHGVTFKQYLQAIRLHHARLRLQEGRSIKETASECGFASVHYFTKVFKTRFKQPPGKFLRSSPQK